MIIIIEKCFSFIHSKFNNIYIYFSIKTCIGYPYYIQCLIWSDNFRISDGFKFFSSDENCTEMTRLLSSFQLLPIWIWNIYLLKFHLVLGKLIFSIGHESCSDVGCRTDSDLPKWRFGRNRMQCVYPMQVFIFQSPF